MESDLIDTAVLETLPELRPHEWNRLQEKVWWYLIVVSPGNGQRLQAARALIKRGFFECNMDYKVCKTILAEYDKWLDEHNDGYDGEGENFCPDGREHFRHSMRSQKRLDQEQLARQERRREERQAQEQGRFARLAQEYFAHGKRETAIAIACGCPACSAIRQELNR